MRSVGIINATPFCYNKEENSYYVSADEYKSLSQWFPLFNLITLYKPIISGETVVKDWMRLPSDIRVIELCKINDSYLHKLSKIKSILKSRPDVDILYFRLPNIESTLFYHYFKKYKMQYFVELHGDMESAVMVSNKPYLIRKSLSVMFRQNIKNICKKAAFGLSIGPALRDKYIDRSVNTLVVTNHLMSKNDYPTEIHPQTLLNNVLNILFVGHLHERKGLKYLFEALNILKARGTNFKLILAGTGDQKLSLESYAKINGFEKNVEFVGQIRHGESLFSLYKNADLFILPSVAAEGVPRVTHEAMVLGCPVIATDIGSVRWQLSGDAGIVVKPRSVDELVNAIEMILTDDQLRVKLQKNGYRRSLEYTLEKQTERIQTFVKIELTKIGYDK